MRLTLPALIAAAALLAAAETGFYLLSGGFFALGRAEALPFIALRPWILLIAALMAVRQPLRRRLLLYFLFLLMAAASETLLVLSLGAADPWPEMLRGLAAGAILALLLDLVLQASRRVSRWGPAVAALALLLLFLTPFALQPYAALVMPAEERQSQEKPQLLLMTALPIIWGEGGAFDPESRPAAAYLALEREFAVRPIDFLDEESLGAAPLLLLAQPRALAPAELVTLDAWIRAGGKALILTDPALMWPTRLPLGDIRRPPPAGLLGPLLAHWRLALDPPARRGEPLTELRLGERKLVVAAPGRFGTGNPNCRLGAAGLMADCAVGSGRAILLADADLLHDMSWVGPGPNGTSRAGRLADNPAVVADLLDRLQRIERPRADGAVQWATAGADRNKALLLAMIPFAAGLGVAFALRLRRRR